MPAKGEMDRLRKGQADKGIAMSAENLHSTNRSPLLTEQEAIVYLRLDVDGPECPQGTLKYYRQHGLLKGAKVGRRMRYSIWALNAMIRAIEDRPVRD